MFLAFVMSYIYEGACSLFFIMLYGHPGLGGLILQGSPLETNRLLQSHIFTLLGNQGKPVEAVGLKGAGLRWSFRISPGRTNPTSRTSLLPVLLGMSNAFLRPCTFHDQGGDGEPQTTTPRTGYRCSSPELPSPSWLATSFQE